MIDTMLDFLIDIKIPPELYALGLGLVLCRYMHNQIKANPKTLGKKWTYFLTSIISKKFLAVVILTLFYWYDHFVWQYDGIRFWEYAVFLCVLLGIKEVAKLAEVWKK